MAHLIQNCEGHTITTSPNSLRTAEETARVLSTERLTDREGESLGLRHGVVTVQKVYENNTRSGILAQFYNGRRL